MIVKINCFMVLLPFRQKLLSRDKGYILSLCVDHILFHFALPYQGLNESLSLHCLTVQETEYKNYCDQSLLLKS